MGKKTLMTPTVRFDSDLSIIETTFHGPFSLEDILDHFTEIAQVAAEKKCLKILGDYRKATPKLSTIEIYELPQKLMDIYTNAGANARATKRAIVVREGQQEYEFYETVTVNSGQNAKIFHDLEIAKKWLLGK